MQLRSTTPSLRRRIEMSCRLRRRPGRIRLHSARQAVRAAQRGDAGQVQASHLRRFLVRRAMSGRLRVPSACRLIGEGPDIHPLTEELRVPAARLHRLRRVQPHDIALVAIAAEASVQVESEAP